MPCRASFSTASETLDALNVKKIFVKPVLSAFYRFFSFQRCVISLDKSLMAPKKGMAISNQEN